MVSSFICIVCSLAKVLQSAPCELCPVILVRFANVCGGRSASLHTWCNMTRPPSSSMVLRSLSTSFVARQDGHCPVRTSVRQSLYIANLVPCTARPAHCLSATSTAIASVVNASGAWVAYLAA
jgi:hypothetical protein